MPFLISDRRCSGDRDHLSWMVRAYNLRREEAIDDSSMVLQANLEPHPYLNSGRQLALAHNPTMAGAQGYMRQSRGGRVLLPEPINPSMAGYAGRGAFAIRAPGCRLLNQRSRSNSPWSGKEAPRQTAGSGCGVGPVLRRGGTPQRDCCGRSPFTTCCSRSAIPSRPAKI